MKSDAWKAAGCTVYTVPDALVVEPLGDFFGVFAGEKSIAEGTYHVERDDGAWSLVVHNGDATKIQKIKDDEKAKVSKAAKDAAAAVGGAK